MTRSSREPCARCLVEVRVLFRDREPWTFWYEGGTPPSSIVVGFLMNPRVVELSFKPKIEMSVLSALVADAVKNWGDLLEDAPSLCDSRMGVLLATTR